MSVGERDKHSGHMTTGHEWNGIKELNTHVPRPVWVFLILAFLISLVMWILLPTWPLGTTYTKGFLGFNEKVELQKDINAAKSKVAAINLKVDEASYDQLAADDKLQEYVRTAGKTLFGDNCSVCHGVDAKGGPGFPNLTDKNWLWGGDVDVIMETLQVGINDKHPDARIAQMPAFGLDETLDAAEIRQVIDYLQSINDLKPDVAATAANIASGAELFEETCAACHNENAKGNQELGAPNLTDAYWIYGGDRQSILTTLWHGREGHMPAWEARLSTTERKLLALYVLDLNAMENK